MELLKLSSLSYPSFIQYLDQHCTKSLNPHGGILFDDTIIGALIDAATEITLINLGMPPLCLNLFLQF